MHEIEIDLDIYRKALEFIQYAADELDIPPKEDGNGDPRPWKEVIRDRASKQGAKFDTEDQFKVQISRNIEIESPQDDSWIEINGSQESRIPMGEMVLIGRDPSDQNLFVVSERNGDTGLEKLQMPDPTVSRVHCMLIRGNGHVEIFKLIDRDFRYEITYHDSF